MTSKELYEKIVSYKPTKAEKEREAQRQKAISDKRAELSKLTAEGNELLRGIDRARMLEGTYAGADRVAEIQQEIRILRNEIRALSIMPIQDDAFVVCSQTLAETRAKRIEAEKRYSEALQEREQSAGSIPFDLYKSLEKECYSLSAEAQKLRKQEDELTDKLKTYDRKTDVMFAEYCTLKDAEVKTAVLASIKELYEILAEAKAERDDAKALTLARKGATPEEASLYMIPFGGDLYRRLMKYCTEIMVLVED